MKAAELLRLYEAGRRDFSGESLRGQTFQGKDLSGVNFSGADIRSTNFTNANLTGTNFTRAKAGLLRRWAVGLIVVSLLLSVVSG
ncbi:MAG: pentapeptide repeat-containing protein, partial [Cyanobacteria bacterium J06626_18]